MNVNITIFKERKIPWDTRHSYGIGNKQARDNKEAQGLTLDT